LWDTTRTVIPQRCLIRKLISWHKQSAVPNEYSEEEGDGTMYDKIIYSSLSFFDGETGNFIGTARFELPTESTKKLLDLLNYGKVPEIFVILDASVYAPAKTYTPPEPSKKYKRLGVMNIVAEDEYSGMPTPFEIRFTYDVVVRGKLSSELLYFDSLEMSNINIISIEQVRF